MKKAEFIRALRMELDFLSKADREDVIKYYDELVTDAVDNGKDEAMFIAGLGSVVEIARNVKQDHSFLDSIRNINFSSGAKEVIGITAKVLGYFLFVILTIVLISVGISFVLSGTTTIILSIISIVVHLDAEVMVTITKVGQIIFGSGLTIIGIWLFIWYAKYAKKFLDKIFNKLQEVFKDKEGTAHV